jgi:hypothetical protein
MLGGGWYLEIVLKIFVIVLPTRAVLVAYYVLTSSIFHPLFLQNQNFENSPLYVDHLPHLTEYRIAS